LQYPRQCVSLLILTTLFTSAGSLQPHAPSSADVDSFALSATGISRYTSYRGTNSEPELKALMNLQLQGPTYSESAWTFSFESVWTLFQSCACRRHVEDLPAFSILDFFAAIDCSMISSCTVVLAGMFRLHSTFFLSMAGCSTLPLSKSPALDAIALNRYAGPKETDRRKNSASLRARLCSG